MNGVVSSLNLHARTGTLRLGILELKNNDLMIPITLLVHYYYINLLDLLIHTLISTENIHVFLLFRVLCKKQMLVVI